MESEVPADRRGAALPAGRDALFILGEPERVSPIFLAALLRPGVREAAARALGTPVPVLHFANIGQKAAGLGSGFAWHRDAANRYLSSRRGHFLRILLCLDAMGPSHRGTAIRPGSHRGPGRPAVIPRCRPGMLVVLDALTLHGGAPNRSAAPRRLMVAQWRRRDDPPRGPAR
jgi:hypothetical protein